MHYSYYPGVLIRFALGFTIVILHMNLSGKTQLSKLTPVDFIGNFILGGIIGGVIYSETIPIYRYVIVLLIGISFITLLNFLSKRLSIFRGVTMGTPIQIIQNGKLLTENIKSNKSRIDIFSISSQIHAQGIKSLQQIYYARIEPSGALTIFCNQKDIPSVLVIAQGEIIKSSLKEINKEKDWLEAELRQNNVELADVFYGEVWNGTLCLALNDGRTIKSEPP